MSAPRHWLPNAVSGFRLALVPPLWVLALSGASVWLGVGLILAGVSDILDGQLARRLDATSRAGAQLDSVADQLLVLSGAVWLVLLRPDVVVAFLVPLQTLLALYLTFLAVGWLRFRRIANLHLWSAKAGAVLLYAFLVHCLLFPGLPTTLFRVMWVTTFLALLEGLAYQVTSVRVHEGAGSLLLVLLRKARCADAHPLAGRREGQ